MTGVDSNNLIKALDTTEKIAASELPEYAEIVDIIHNNIIQSITSETKFRRKAVSTMPSYRGANHWVIEHIQNYILTYFNRLFKRYTGVTPKDFRNNKTNFQCNSD